MLLQLVYQLFGRVFFEVVVIFWRFFCVIKLGIKTNVPIFNPVAGMKRELICLFMFLPLQQFLCYFLLDFIMRFLSFLKSIRYVYRKLISKFVDVESGLHHVCKGRL